MNIQGGYTCSLGYGKNIHILRIKTGLRSYLCLLMHTPICIHIRKKHRSSLHNKSTKSRAVKSLQSLVSAQSHRGTDRVQRPVLTTLEQAASSFSSLAEYSGSKNLTCHLDLILSAVCFSTMIVCFHFLVLHPVYILRLIRHVALSHQ